MNKEEAIGKTNKEVAYLLRTVAAALVLKNKNRFRVIAYENAADAVEYLPQEIYGIWKKGTLHEIQGIGATIAEALDEYLKTGKSDHFDDLKKGIPETVFELMKLSSVGPKRAYKLVTEFKLLNKKTLLTDLKKKIAQNKVAVLPGFGEKSQEQILKAIQEFQGRTQENQRIPYADAKVIADELLEFILKSPDVKRADALGSLRRKVATIGDIDIAVVAKKGKEQAVVDHFLEFPKKLSVINAGPKKASIYVPPQLRVDLRVHPAKSYGSMLQYFTGSKDHNVRLREYGLSKGYSLSEWGIKDIRSKDKKLYEFPDEKSFYRFLGLGVIPPEERIGQDEIRKAKLKT